MQFHHTNILMPKNAFKSLTNFENGIALDKGREWMRIKNSASQRRIPRKHVLDDMDGVISNYKHKSNSFLSATAITSSRSMSVTNSRARIDI